MLALRLRSRLGGRVAHTWRPRLALVNEFEMSVEREPGLVAFPTNGAKNPFPPFGLVSLPHVCCELFLEGIPLPAELTNMIQGGRWIHVSRPEMFIQFSNGIKGPLASSRRLAFEIILPVD